ncbi:MAG: hypothetical protein IPK07_12295 [Deltaproteobacteria bacterium]|jgi:hypothetical protein|nr:hypothetical protein [Deltaproteobacteria bacterium]
MMSRSFKVMGLATCAAIALTVAAGARSTARAEESMPCEACDHGSRGGAGHGSVIFRGAYSALSSDRGGEVFTDAASGLGSGPSNDGKGGFGVAAALNLAMWAGPDMSWMPGDATIVGEIFVEYSKFSNESVVQTASALLGAPALHVVNVTQLEVAVSPKVKFNSSCDLQPFIIPIGLAFLVPSPPTNNTTYLDLGLVFGGGIDYKIHKLLSVGMDVRYTWSLGEAEMTDTSYLSAGGYVGVNF